MLRIKELRQERGWSQMDLAVRLEPPKHPRVISSWENSRCMPRPGTLRELAEAFGVSIRDLFTRDTAVKG